MPSFFEENFQESPAVLMARLLQTQTDSYGFLDVPAFREFLSTAPAGRILDVGCGDGSFLMRVAAELPEREFVGIDLNDALLSTARSGIAEQNIRNIELRTTKLEDVQSNERFSAVFSRFTVQHVSDPSTFIASIFEKTHPGGGVFFIDPVYQEYDCDPPVPVWAGFRQRIIATYRCWRSDPNAPRRMPVFLRDAGFVSIRSAVNTYSPVTIGPERFRNVVLATARTLQVLHPELWEPSFLEELAQWLALAEKMRIDPYISLAHVTAKAPVG